MKIEDIELAVVLRDKLKTLTLLLEKVKNVRAMDGRDHIQIAAGSHSSAQFVVVPDDIAAETWNEVLALIQRDISSQVEYTKSCIQAL